MKTKKLNNKGFTLTEVIAVVIIMAILLLIAVPAISSLMVRFRKDYYVSLEKSITTAGERFFADNRIYRPAKENETAYVNVKTLIEKGYIKDSVKTKKTGGTETGKSLVDYRNNNCDINYDKESYVVIINKGDGQYEYTTCLRCSKDNYDTRKKCQNLTGDRVPPTCGTVTGDSATWVNSNRTISITCIDEESGCKQDVYTETFTVGTGGSTKTANIMIEDEAGNKTNCPVNVYIDKTVPSVAITAKKGSSSGDIVASNVWSDQNLYTTIAVTNTVPSGSTIKYCTDTTNTCTPITTYSSAFTVSTNGTSYIRYQVTSGTGVTSTVASYIAKIDTYTPSVSITARKGNSSGATVSSGTSSSESLHIALTTTHSGSSGTTTKYCIDTTNTCMPSTTYSAAFMHSTEGTRYIRYQSTSGAGKESTVTSFTAVIAYATPTVSITARKGSSTGTIISSDTWSDQTLHITLTAGNVDTSGATIKYCTDTTNTCTPSTTYSAAFTHSTSGTSYIRYNVTSGMGKTSATSSFTSKIDTAAAPTISITARKGSSTGTTVSSNTWSNQNLHITLAASYSGSSGTTIKYCTDTTNTCTPSTTYSAAFTYSTNGTTYIRYQVTSGTGKISAVSSYIAKIDTVSPVCGTQSGGGTTWTNANRTVTMPCSDASSGCTASSYSNTWSTGSTSTSSITITDNVGNTRSCSVNVYVDKVAPYTPYWASLGSVVKSGTSTTIGTWGTENCTTMSKTLTAAHSCTAIVRVNYASCSSSVGWSQAAGDTSTSSGINWDGKQVEPVNGGVSQRVRVADNAGNWSPWLTYTITWTYIGSGSC